ncbi:MAG TPA: hypothetical protein VGN88_08220 [Phycisphaerae bacterium]|jgi:hypothetical protein
MNRSDRSIRVLLGAICFLLGANLLVNMHDSGRTAMAAATTNVGLPDTAALQQAQIDQLTALNAKVEKLQGYLESGKMVVEVKDTKPAK